MAVKRSEPNQERLRTHRAAWAFIGLAVCVFIFVSLMSFSVYDWPNPDVAPARVQGNLCGRTGAFIAYYSNYYLGPAGIPLLVGVMVWLIMQCLQKPMEQTVLRLIGVILIGAAVSAGVYMFRPGGANSLTQGNGGVLGIALGHFLVNYTALTGATLILMATLIVGLLLAADNVIFLLPGLLFSGADKLRRAGPVLSGVGVRTSIFGSRTKQKMIDAARALTVATPQSEAAIRQVTSLDEHEEEEDSLTGEHQAVSTGTDTVDRRELSGKAQQRETERKSSLETVQSALARMRGILAKPASSPLGTDGADYREYKYPPLDLLEEPQRGFSALQEKIVREKGRVLEQTLGEFNIEARVVEAETGPVITMFELQLAPGIKVAQISNLANDLARSLGAAAVRVVAPLPGKHTIGIEVPNSEKEKVRIKELLQLAGDKASKMQIPLFLGKDASGEGLIVDLTTLPHLLIAGTTGSGKSVCINAIITSILLTQRPDVVKLILVDPKMVEMNAFRELPHLMCPIVTEMKRAEQILEWLTVKMDERYALLAEARVRNIAGYNRLTEEQIYERFCPSNDEEKAKIPLRLPYLVIIIDELADLMMTSAKEVEGYIIRVAQKSRAIGIHIVLATQRPQATVVTGLIKSNLPSRISFRVAARMDSRIVLDQNGAEALLGLGDMLFLQPGTSDLIRAQGTFISDTEIHRIMKFLKEVAQPHYHPELIQLNHVNTGDMEKDELFDEAVRIVLETRRGSVSLLQRRLTIGYSRASRLIDQMALAGIVGEYKGSQAREVLITPADYEIIKEQMDRDAAQDYRDLQEDDDNQTATEPTGAGSTIPAAQVKVESEEESDREWDENSEVHKKEQDNEMALDEDEDYIYDNGDDNLK